MSERRISSELALVYIIERLVWKILSREKSKKKRKGKKNQIKMMKKEKKVKRRSVEIQKFIVR